jgi:hypothetical protein
MRAFAVRTPLASTSENQTLRSPNLRYDGNLILKSRLHSLPGGNLEWLSPADLLDLLPDLSQLQYTAGRD